MASVQIVSENLPSYCPVSNLYKVVGEDKYFVVTVTDPHELQSIFADQLGTTMLSHVKPEVSVFLSDERGRVIDYDGDPDNGLTPILSTNPRSFAGMVVPDLADAGRDPYADALAILGYELEEVE